MGEKITEAQVADLLANLRKDITVDAKVQQINQVKSGIKQNNVPDSCVPSLFEIARATSTSQHAPIANAGFSTLNHLLTRLSRQEPKWLGREAGRTLPLVVEKLGDQKEKYRVLAAQCLTTFWKVAPTDAERFVKNSAMASKSPRAKEASLQWLVQMHEENGLQFRSFVPSLMELLEDADGMVRDAARASVIELFKNAPNTARSDLKKQMKIYNVRPAIVTAITGHLAPTAGAQTETDSEPPSLASSRNHLADSMTSTASSTTRPETPVAPEQKADQVEPAYVNTQRELDETFRDMHPFFDGKESEQNWLKREQSMTKLRRLNVGNAPADFHDAYAAGLKGMLDGILKAVNSLRTSLSKEGCFLVQEVARTLGPGMDSMVEILLQSFIKLCAGTKKISSQMGSDTVDVIVGKVSYNIRIMQHIWSACQDKNVQPRTYATRWLRTIVKKEAHHKSHVEHSGGLDLMEKSIKKGLADPNPGVREKMRGTYWAFAQVWPQKATSIMSSLDPQQQRLLEQDPGNPKSPKKSDPSSTGSGPIFSKSTTGPPKPSLRETMLAQKKATMAATKNLPARPGSAMSTFSPVRNVSTSSTSSMAPKGTEAGPSRPRPELSSSASHGGLSVAPMRPAKFKRPELARPATAGPYSIRRPNAPSTENSTSPPGTRTKTRTPSVSSPQKKPIPRPNTSQSNHSIASHSSHPSPSKNTSTRPAQTPHHSPSKSTTTRATQSPHSSPSKSSIGRVGHQSPRISPARARTTAPAHAPSPSRGDEDLTMVMPTLHSMNQLQPTSSAETRSEVDAQEEKDLITPMKSLKVYEDPFTSADDQTTPRPPITEAVLEEVPVNEDAANLARVNDMQVVSKETVLSPERSKQNSRLLDSGMTRIKAKSLDVHGFRKLQGLIRDNRAALADEGKFDDLILGLFEYLEAALPSLTAEKAQDVKAQIIATVKLVLKRDIDAFKPYVLRGLHSLVTTRSAYDSRAHLVSGLELLAAEFVTLAAPDATISAMTALLQQQAMDTPGCRALSMGLHILRELLGARQAFVPEGAAVEALAGLARRCLESKESGVRMDAVALCVVLQARLGEARFWEVMRGVGENERSLITYYVVKREREASAA